MTRYSEDFKNAIINKVLSPEAKSIRSVAHEHEVPIATVLNWLRKHDEVSRVDEKLAEDDKRNVVTDNLKDKFKIILDTAPMSPEEVGAYCRNRGIYTEDIAVWKQEMTDNLDARNKQILTKVGLTQASFAP